jgi:adenosylcobinamide-phosphate synthase
MGLGAALESDLALLGGAILVEGFLGEPPAAWHPVVWMGRVTRAAERRLIGGAPVAQLGAGLLMALAIPLAFAAGAGLSLRAAAPWPPVHALLGIWWLKSTFAVRALGAAARAVRDPLRRQALAPARRALRGLCSRDPAALDAVAVTAATVESLAENSSDSVVAPLFYFALFGVPGAVFYRAVNTLDAMIGYHGPYEYLGKAAARLDDLLNLVPARLTAALLLLGGALTGQDPRGGWRVLRRDGGRTESPNAGRPMAAMAGLLRVQLDKRDCYRLGDPLEPAGIDKIDAAWRVVLVASAAAFLATAAALAVAGGRHAL